jgi:surfactin synthase thioesterase subunit
MPSDPELRREIADERRQLTNAVADLRKELDHTAERGKQVGVMVGAVMGAAIAIRTALRIRRRFSD